MINQYRKSKDICYGGKKEVEYKPLLEKHFNCSLTKTENMYAPYDYYGENTFIELKSRRIYHSQYPTIVLGYNKVKTAQRKYKEGQFYFVFGFTDGLYYISYNDNQTFFDNLKPKQLQLKRGDLSSIIEIPIRLLKKMDV